MHSGKSSQPGIALATVGQRSGPLPQGWGPLNIEELQTTAAVTH